MNFLSTLTGSFAQPADENPTVAMMTAAYEDMGLDARYINCEVAPADLGDAVRGARAMGWAGFNCSLPHKVAVIELLDELAESARIIGAVNCVVREGDRLVGHNTDGQGFVASLREALDPRGCEAVVLGAGGAARAVAVELGLSGASHVAVAARREDEAERIASLVTERTTARGSAVRWSGTLGLSATTDLLVNATSIGLFPDVAAKPDVDLSGLAATAIVADVVPNPPATALLAAAGARGLVTLDGLGMLVNQGARAVELWTGVTPDRGVMRSRLAEIFG